jgi:hypothetical protein
MLRRRLFFIGFLCIVGWVGTSLLQAQQHRTAHADPPPRADSLPVIPTERSGDSYAIYSMLLPGEPFDKMAPEQTRQWMIADVTMNIDDMNPRIPPDGQLKAPPENPRGFNEALLDYRQRRFERFQVTRDFTVSHPYGLMDTRHARQLHAAASQFQSGNQTYPGVTFFSAVYFNAEQTAALVYMNNWCANLCSAGTWIYLEKHGGQWVRRSGITTRIQ